MTLEGRLLSGSYRVLRRLGGGGMGEVYEARHERLPRRFAIKTLQTGLGGEHYLARFRREAELASQLAHPHILEVLDYNVTEDGTPYFVMPLLEGEDLGQRLERCKRLPLVEAVRIVRQVGAALAATHARGVVHRDLKPRNVFLARSDDGQETVKVLDFGVSKLLAGGGGGLTREGMLLGSPRYMAPEQALGHVEVDGRADLFALGVMIYEMLGGEAAFSGDSELEVLHRVACEEPRPLEELAPEVPEAVVAVLARALAKERRARYLCATALALDLAAAAGLPPLDGPAEGYLAQTPVISSSSGAAPLPLSRTPRVAPSAGGLVRSRHLWLGLLVGALLTTALAAVLLWRPGRELREAAALAARGAWPQAVERLERVPVERRGGRWLHLLERAAQELWQQLPAGTPDQLTRLRSADALLARYPALRTPALLSARAARGLLVLRDCYRRARFGNPARCLPPPGLPPEVARCFFRPSVGEGPCPAVIKRYTAAHGPLPLGTCEISFRITDCDESMRGLARGDSARVSLLLDLAELVAAQRMPAMALPLLLAAARLAPDQACDCRHTLEAVATAMRVAPAAPTAAEARELAATCWSGLQDRLVLRMTDLAFGAGPAGPSYRANYCAVWSSRSTGMSPWCTGAERDNTGGDREGGAR